MIGLTFKRLQIEHRAWASRNFGTDGDPRFRQRGAILGVAEEIGEFAEECESDEHVRWLTIALGRLAHAVLKAHQGIRTDQQHSERAKDAVADIVIFLADYCTRQEWDLQAIVEQTWLQVQRRNWQADPVAGAERNG